MLDVVINTDYIATLRKNDFASNFIIRNNIRDRTLWEHKGEFYRIVNWLTSPQYIVEDGIRVAEYLSDGTFMLYEYDDRGNQTKAVKDGCIVEYTYDSDDNIVLKTDIFGTTSYDYDTLGNKIKSTSPLGFTKEFDYDDHGNICSIRMGDQVCRYEYDDDNNPIKETLATGVSWQYEYNDKGFVIKEIAPTGNIWLTDYDDNNNVIMEQTHTGTIWNHHFNDDNQITETTSNINGEIESYKYEYDEVGNMISETMGDDVFTWSFEWYSPEFFMVKENGEDKMQLGFIPA